MYADVRNLIFPMTARDLVQSAVVVGIWPRGNGPEMQMNVVDSIEEQSNGMLKIWFNDVHAGMRWETVLKPDTLLLVTNIRRS